MEKQLYLGNLKFTLEKVFSGENGEDLQRARLLYELARVEKISFEKAFYIALTRLGMKIETDDSEELEVIWEKCIKSNIPEIDERFLEEYNFFLKFPNEWADIIDASDFDKEGKICFLKSFISISLDKIKFFKDMTDKMHIGHISDNAFYIFDELNLPYHLARPQDVCDYCIVIADQCCIIKKCDGTDIPNNELELFDLHIDIDNVELPTEYQNFDDNSPEIRCITPNEIMVNSISTAVRVLQLLMK